MTLHNLSFMKPLSFKFPRWIVLLFALAPSCLYGAWFDSTWQYRVPLSIPASATVNSTIKVNVDFAALLTTLGVTGTFDVNSPRVVRANDTLSTTQEYTDTIYAGATDATGNSRGEIRFILEDAGATTYYLYFDITANGAKATNPQTPINGNFERGSAGTQNPTGWSATKTNTNFDAQVVPSENPSIRTNGSSPSPSPNTKTTNGQPNTGSFSYLLGSRTNDEAVSASPGITLQRTLQVPASNPGNLVIRYRLEGWDSSDNAATQFDFLRIRLIGSSTTEIIGPTYGNYVTLPFSPNKGLIGISNSGSGNSGYGNYNFWDMDKNGNHKSGMTLAAQSEPWFTRTYDLSGYTGQAITLSITSSHEVEFKSWIHIDDVEWSVVAATLGTPEAFTVSAIFAEYRMEQSSWNGTASEVIDNTGSFSGTAASSSATKPSPVGTTPAISGDPGTCRYGVFNRTNKDYVALPSSFPNLGASGSAFTITAWIKTTDNTQPGQRIFIDDENNSAGYGFSLGDGGTGLLRFYSRGTPSSLQLDTGNVIGNNTWYFIAAVINVPSKTKTIYVYNTAGTQLANVSSTWTESSFGSDSGIASIGGETNASSENNNAFGFSGNIDEVRVYQSALNVTALTAIRQSTHTCPTITVGSTPSNFNCIESGNTASTGHLYTKVAGTPLSFDVAALKTDGSVETSFVVGTNKTVTVELVDGTGSTACASRASLSPAVSQSLTFSASDLGRKAISSITLSNAYTNLRCRVTDANQSPTVVGCSTDSFAVRPSAFTITSNMNADASGASSSATPILKTGASFTLNAASGAVGYNATPQLDTSKVAAHSGAIQNGTLNGSFSAANASTGTASGAAFTYSEVGYFNLATNGVNDTNFTAIDSAAGDCTADYSNSPVAGKYGCNFGNTAATTYFGRFIPDHFAITVGTATPACSTVFTYFGQDGFSTLFTLIAQNSSNTTNKNYNGSFARLGLTTWSGFNFTSTSLPGGSVLSASATAPLGAWRQGIADITAKHQASKPTAVAAETSVVVNAAPIDPDGVTMTSSAVAASTPLRYGRLALQNAHGSELMQLPVSLTAQYWNGTAFVLNTSDSCTTVTAPANGSGLTFYTEAAASVPGNHLSAAETTASVSNTGRLVAGDAQLKFTAPGNGNDGYFDLSITAPNWLKFDWNTAIAGEESPSGRATFGIYKGNDSQIYLREVY
jgi:MSHA biogenesis protein MshQ